MGWVASNLVVMPLPVAFCSMVPRSPRPTTTAREAKNRGCVVLPMLATFPLRPPVSRSGRVLDGVAAHDVDLAPLIHRDNRAVQVGERLRRDGHDRLDRIDGARDRVVKLNAVRGERAIDAGLLKHVLHDLPNGSSRSLLA